MNKKQKTVLFVGLATLAGYYFLVIKKDTKKPPLILTPDEQKQLQIELNPANRGKVAPVISQKVLQYQKG